MAKGSEQPPPAKKIRFEDDAQTSGPGRNDTAAPAEVPKPRRAKGTQKKLKNTAEDERPRESRSKVPDPEGVADESSTREENAEPSKSKRGRKRMKEGEMSKLSQTNIRVAEQRRSSLRRCLAAVLVMSGIEWDSYSGRSKGFKLGVELLLLNVTSSTAFLRFVSGFPPNARRNALLFVSNVLSPPSEKHQEEKYGKDIRRLHVKNLHGLYTKVASDLNIIFDLNMHVKDTDAVKDNSILDMERLFKVAENVVDMSIATVKPDKTLFAALFTPCFMLSVGVSFAARMKVASLRKEKGRRIPKGTEIVREVHNSMHSFVLNPTIAVTSDGSLFRSELGHEHFIYRVVVISHLFDVVFRILNSLEVEGISFSSRDFAITDLVKAHEKLGTLLRGWPKVTAITVRLKEWKILFLLLQGISATHSSNYEHSFDGEWRSLAANVNFRRDVWGSKCPAASVSNIAKKEQYELYLSQLGKVKDEFESWSSNVMTDYGDDAVLKSCYGESCFQHFHGIMEDSIRCVRDAMELGSHITGFANAEMSDIKPGRVNVVCGVPVVHNWIATVIRVLGLTLAGKTCSTALQSAYKEDIVSLYINRLTESGERNKNRVPLRNDLRWNGSACNEFMWKEM